MTQCGRCRNPATTKRLVRLQDREWLIPLCHAHGQILDRMLAAWTRDAQQLMPILLPPRLSPLWPPAEIPDVDRSQLGNLIYAVNPRPPVPRPVPPVPASPRARPRFSLIEGTGPAPDPDPSESGSESALPPPALAVVPASEPTPTPDAATSAGP